jgi:hypothetical protein
MGSVGVDEFKIIRLTGRMVGGNNYFLRRLVIVDPDVVAKRCANWC